jgi:hypothetical protein
LPIRQHEPDDRPTARGRVAEFVELLVSPIAGYPKVNT